MRACLFPRQPTCCQIIHPTPELSWSLLPLHPVVRVPQKPPDRKEEVSAEKRTGAVKHLPLSNAAIVPHKPMPASVTRIPPASPSSQTIAMQHMPTDIKGTRQGMSKTAHHMVKACMRARVLSKAAAPWFNKIPSANSIECYNKHSNMIVVTVGTDSHPMHT